MTAEPILSQARSFPQGRSQLVATVRRSFSFAASHRGAHSLAEVPTAPVGDAFEIAVNRKATDVVVHGHVVLGGARQAVAEVQVGAARRAVRAFGARTIESVVSGRVLWSGPAAAERVALTASNAYGGAWEDALPDWFGLLGSAALRRYPRNPEGRGFVLMTDASALEGQLMPSLEDPDSPVLPESMLREDLEDWLDAPFPPLFSWMDPTTFPRCRFFGTRLPHRAARSTPRECALGVLTSREIGAARLDEQVDAVIGPKATLTFEPRAFSAGAMGLSNRRLVGGEPVVLRGLFADAPERSFAVPAGRTVVRMTPPGCPRFDLPTELAALVIDADTHTVTTVEQTALDVAAEYPEEELRAVRLEARTS